MVVASAEAEATAAIGTFYSPADVLRLAVGNSFTHMGIAAVGAIGAVECRDGREVGENGGYAVHFITKSHMIIPFIVG